MPPTDPRETAIHFPHGLPGFEHERHFHLVEHSRLAPLVFLQSDQTAELCFVAVPVETVEPDYDLPVSEIDCETLALNATANGLLGLAIVTVPEDGPATANLMAPIVVNLPVGVGAQVVRADQRYSHRHPIGAPSCS